MCIRDRNKSLENRSRLTLDSQVKQNQTNVASAWSNYQSNKSLLNSVQLQVRAAEIANEGISAKYNSGAGRTTLEVIQSNSLLLNAQISLANSERNFILPVPNGIGSKNNVSWQGGNMNALTGAAAGAIDQVLYSNVFEGLTRFASDGSIIPGLAKSWDVSSDGLTYTFHLQEDVKFHDGTDMNAMDVKFSLDRARAEDTTNAQKALFAGISNVEVVDNLKVKITLDKPNGNFLFNLAWGDAVVVAVDSICLLYTSALPTIYSV